MPCVCGRFCCTRSIANAPVSNGGPFERPQSSSRRFEPRFAAVAAFFAHGGTDFSASCISCRIKFVYLRKCQCLRSLLGHYLLSCYAGSRRPGKRINGLSASFFCTVSYRIVRFLTVWNKDFPFFRMDKTKIVAIFVGLCLATDLRRYGPCGERKKHKRIEPMHLCLK